MAYPEAQVPEMDDFEIQRRVESIAGKNARVVDCEKKSSFMSEETLLINGVPVKLEGPTGDKIKEALKSGQPPPVELLSEILVQAGIEKNPVQLETTMSVKSTTKTSELSTLRDRHGQLMDEKLKEFEEDDEIQTASVEIWEKDSEEAEKLRKTYKDFKSNMEPYIIPKPLPRAYTQDRTSPKTSSRFSHMQSNMSRKPPTPIKPQQYSNNSNQYLQNQTSSVNRPSEPPPRIPSLMKPFKPNAKPIPPPKPKSKQQVAAGLKREIDMELPVRVVYETFI